MKLTNLHIRYGNRVCSQVTKVEQPHALDYLDSLGDYDAKQKAQDWFYALVKSNSLPDALDLTSPNRFIRDIAAFILKTQ